MTIGRSVRLVHDVGAILPEIAGGWLLDVENAFEAARRRLPNALEAVQQVRDVRTAFVEIEQVFPIGDVSPIENASHDPVGSNDSLDVGVQIATIELDLESRQAIAGDPLFERVGQPILDLRAHVGSLERVARAD